MVAWWEGLSSFQQVVFVFAASATLIMIILLILMLIGIGDSDVDDIDLDVTSEPLVNISGLKIFTLRGALAFLSIGGWVAFLLEPSLRPFWAIVLGIIAGSVAAFLMALAFKAAMKLESEGNLNYQNAIHKVGSVYIRIPANRAGKGKITITFQERFLEIDAVTDEKEDLKTGTEVEVVDLLNESTLIVKKR